MFNQQVAGSNPAALTIFHRGNMADQFKVATESKLIHRFNRANTKMFVYRHVLDKEPCAIFTKQGNLLVHEGRRFTGVAAALESLDNPHIKR